MKYQQKYVLFGISVQLKQPGRKQRVVLYAPRCFGLEDAIAIVRERFPKPTDILTFDPFFLTVEDAAKRYPKSEVLQVTEDAIESHGREPLVCVPIETLAPKKAKAKR